jgi:hypothetical protein
MIASRSDGVVFDPAPLGRSSGFWFVAATIAVTVGVAGCTTLGAGYLAESIDSAVATSVLGLGFLGIMVRRLRFAAVMAALPALLGLWSLVVGSSLGAEESRAILALLSPDAVGPMGSQSAVMLSCIGLSLQLSAQRAPRLWARAVAWALVVVALMVPCVVLIGYATGTPGLVAWDGAVPTPLPLLLTLLVLALTLLFSPLHARRAPAVRWVHVLSVIAVVAGLTGTLWLDARSIESQRTAIDVVNIAELASRIVDSQAATRTRALAGLAEMLGVSGQTLGRETGALLTWYGLQNPGLLGLLENRDGEWHALLAPSQERIDALLRSRSLAGVREATSLAPGEQGARFSLIPGEAGEPLVGLIQRYIGAQGDGRTAGLRLEQAGGVPGPGLGALRDEDVPDVSGVARGPLEQATAADDAATDAGGDHQGHEVGLPRRRPPPPLAEGECLGVVVDGHGEPQVVGEAVAQREAPPARDVQRGDVLAPRGHRPAAPNAAGGHRLAVPHPVDELDQGAEDLLGRAGRRGPGIAAPQRAVAVDDAGGQLGPADVDGQGRHAGNGRRRPSERRAGPVVCMGRRTPSPGRRGRSRPAAHGQTRRTGWPRASRTQCEQARWPRRATASRRRSNR